MKYPSIQTIFQSSWEDFCRQYTPSDTQYKVAWAIMNCKTGTLGYHASICTECEHTEIHHNSCRNRHCPQCQGVLSILWVDNRRAEVIDTPYFHAVFTVPAELNPLLYANQKLLYALLHKCSAETLLELSADKKYLGATPGIIQVLHTHGQTLNFHPHIHCIISGGGLTSDQKLKKSSAKFFLPVKVISKMFRGKFLSYLQSYYEAGTLSFPGTCTKLRNSFDWNEFRDNLYKKDWCAYVKETFNGFGNAIEYLGRYTHRIAISNARLLEVTDDSVVFTARDYKTGTTQNITLTHVEFIRRFMMHVLPHGFQKIRYYGFLTNRSKKNNLKIIFRIQGHQRFRAKYAGLSIADLLKQIWNTDIRICKICGCQSMHPGWRSFGMLN